MEADNLLDDNKEVCKISTRDLILWSFQIVCGMVHLANKKVPIKYTHVNHNRPNSWL